MQTQHELDAPPWRRVESTLMATARAIRQAYAQRLRPLDLNLSQALQIANGSYVNDKVTNGGNRVRELLSKRAPRKQIVTDLYLAAYSRPPTNSELTTFDRYAEKQSDAAQEQVYEDLLWSLLNSNEFLFQH